MYRPHLPRRYAFNIAFNLLNKSTLNIFPAPWFLATFQLSEWPGWVCQGPGTWADGDWDWGRGQQAGCTFQRLPKQRVPGGCIPASAGPPWRLAGAATWELQMPHSVQAGPRGPPTTP